MKNKIPRILYVALMAGASAILTVLQSGVNMDALWGPVILALLGVAVRLLDSLNPRVTTMARGLDNPGFARRFFTE